MKKSNKSKTPHCPKCGNNDQVITILYGMPAPEVFDEVEKGKIKLGGCIVGEQNKAWYCKRDNIEFNKEK